MINVGDKVKVVTNIVDDGLLIGKVFTVDYIEKIIGTTLYTIKDDDGNYYKILPEYIEKHYEENRNAEEATTEVTEGIDNVPYDFIKIVSSNGNEHYLNINTIIDITPIYNSEYAKSRIIHFTGKYIETQTTVEELFNAINTKKTFKYLSERSQFFKTQV